MSFHVGQLVLCVNADPYFIRPRGTHNGNMSGLTAGVVYTVRAMMMGVWGEPDIYLEEIVRPTWCGIEYGFHPRRFRPLSEDRLAIFRQHLAPLSTDKVEA